MKSRTAKNQKRGRPTVRTEAVVEELLAWIEDGKTLRAFCRQPGKPRHAAVYEWLASDVAFSRRFARAREVGFDAIAEEALEIADTQIVGEIEKVGPDGTTITREDMLGHRKLQVEARLKLLAKWDPKRYGEKVDVAHSGGLLVSKGPPLPSEERLAQYLDGLDEVVESLRKPKTK